jgi:hypothetical protein
MEVESGDESDASMSSRSSEDFLYESPSEDEDGVVMRCMSLPPMHGERPS